VSLLFHHFLFLEKEKYNAASEAQKSITHTMTAAMLPWSKPPPEPFPLPTAFLFTELVGEAVVGVAVVGLRVGDALGDNDGFKVGERVVGDEVRAADGAGVVEADGLRVGMNVEGAGVVMVATGARVLGMAVGLAEGARLLGMLLLGALLGVKVGEKLGMPVVGELVTCNVGAVVGRGLGKDVVGLVLGVEVLAADGATVGLIVVGKKLGEALGNVVGFEADEAPNRAAWPIPEAPTMTTPAVVMDKEEPKLLLLLLLLPVVEEEEEEEDKVLINDTDEPVMV